MQFGEDPNPRSYGERFGDLRKRPNGDTFDGAVRGVGPGQQAIANSSGPVGDGPSPEGRTIANSLTQIDPPPPHRRGPVHRALYPAEIPMPIQPPADPIAELCTPAHLSVKLRVPYRQLVRLIAAHGIRPTFQINGVAHFDGDAIIEIERLIEQPEPAAPKRTRRTKRAD